MQSVRFESSVIESYPTRAAWDAAATDLVRTMLERWHLSAGEAFVGGEAAATLRVITSDGSPAVLKVGFPHPEAIAEALAMAVWSAEDLAPAVLKQDPWTWSMLLDEVRPGTPLREAPPGEAVDAGARLMARLHATRAPDGIPSLMETVLAYLAAARSNHLEQRAQLTEFGLPSLDWALDQGERLADDAVGAALLHGDFNPGNVLAGRDSQWFAIDPKPMIGDPAFDIYPLASQLGGATDAPSRLLRVATLIDCEPQRAVRWAAVRSALNVSWYLTDGDHEAVRAASVEAAMWRGLL